MVPRSYQIIISAIPREWLLSDNVQRVGTTQTLISKLCLADKANNYAYTAILSKFIEFANNLIKNMAIYVN